MFDDEFLAILSGNSTHSLLLVFSSSAGHEGIDVLLQEDGSAVLQESSDYILLDQ